MDQIGTWKGQHTSIFDAQFHMQLGQAEVVRGEVANDQHQSQAEIFRVNMWFVSNSEVNHAVFICVPWCRKEGACKGIVDQGFKISVSGQSPQG